MKKQEKQVTSQKNRKIFSYLLDQSKKKIEAGIRVNPQVYVVTSKGNGNDPEIDKILPIDLSESEDATDRKSILSALGFILSEEDVKVKMFVSVFEGWAKETKGNPVKEEVLCGGAIDIHGNNADVVYDIKRDKGSITLTAKDEIKWKKIQKKPKLFNGLLRSIYESYVQEKKKSNKETTDITELRKFYHQSPRTELEQWLHKVLPVVVKTYGIGNVNIAYLSLRQGDTGVIHDTQDEDIVFSIRYERSYKTAFITVYKLAYDMWEEGEMEVLWHAATHEIAHLITENLANVASNRFTTSKEIRDSIEETTESVAQIGRDLLRKTNPELFKF